jgi:hypothetical protein
MEPTTTLKWIDHWTDWLRELCAPYPSIRADSKCLSGSYLFRWQIYDHTKSQLMGHILISSLEAQRPADEIKKLFCLRLTNIICGQPVFRLPEESGVNQMG